ncbi:MAG: hypothetical protein DA446_02795 [Bacteroidetes bacterium]|nr:MAG: hypothetical protein DA443_04115 [Bacteroidota bacterium]PTM20532.1 MAG: hypothetical protein DA446_02795 [Bacteroidota bacterium]
MPKELQFDRSQKYSDLFRAIHVNSTYLLILMVGSYKSAEVQFFESFTRNTGLELMEYDMNDLIFGDEEKTKSRINSFFKSLPKSSNAIILRNADRLNGAFTGNSISKMRYATPQEKYFLSCLDRSETILFLDFSNRANIIPAFRRYAHLIVDFTASAGLVRRFIGRYLNFSILGGRFDTKTKIMTR